VPRRLALWGVALTLAAAFGLAAFPGGGWLFLGLASIYPLIEMGLRKRSVRQVDGAVALFLLTAVVGVFTAYDTAGAVAKLQLVASSAAVYLALSYQPNDNFAALAVMGTFFVAAICAVFLLGEDWTSHPSSLYALHEATDWWAAVRPDVGVSFSDRDLVGGALTIFMPLVAVPIIASFGARRWLTFLLAIGACVPLGVTFLSITERGAILGLAVGGGLVSAGLVMTRLPVRLRWLCAGIAVVAMAVGAWAVRGMAFDAGGVIPLLDRFPGSPTLGDRLDLAANTLDLIGDTWITGGGLGAFPGLYSRYVLLIPDFFLSSSHNLYLDIGLEQGVGGLLAVAAAYIACMASLGMVLFRRPESPRVWLSAGMFVSLASVMVYGAVEDPFFDGRGLGMLFVVPGLAVAFLNSRSPSEVVDSKRSVTTIQTSDRRLGQPSIVFLALGILLVGVLGGFYRAKLMASWYADLGSVAMAKAELRGWQGRGQGRVMEPPDLLIAQLRLEKALALDSSSTTARFRLGVLALDRREFGEAVALMLPAHVGGPGRRGLTKALGYALIWHGQVQQGAALLLQIPEAPSELDTYRWWWGTQSRPDLSRFAELAAEQLSSSTSHSLP